MADKDEILQELADAGVDLAEYASYSEIVGGVSHNRSAIRKWCDKVFEKKRELDNLRDTTGDKDND